MKLEQENWEVIYNQFCPMDLGLFQAVERERVLEVLQRDKALRTIEADRIRLPKPSCVPTVRDHARDVSGFLGSFGTVVRCAVDAAIASVNTVGSSGLHRSGSAQCAMHTALLLSCLQLLLLFMNPPSYNRLIHLTEQDLKKSKPFTKSVENLMVSVSAHIKKFSKSQNDLSVEVDQLTVDHGQLQNSRHKSRSESAINKVNLCKVPSLPNLSQNSRGIEHYASTSTLYLTDDDASYTSAYSDEQRDSNSSTGMDCGIFENTSVTGEVEVAFAYNNRTSCLEITIKACKNLMFGDMKKKCHPKCCFFLNKQCVVAAEQLGSSIVQVSVWHSRGLKRKLFLGETHVCLSDLCLESTDTQRSVCYALGPKGHPLGGDEELLLKAQFQFLPQTYPHTTDVLIGAAGQLKVVITNASKLSTLSKTAYIEGILCLPGDRELVQRTPALKKTASSVQMNFSRFTRQELQQAALQINLWEKNTFSLTDRLMRSARLAGESSWQRLQQMPGEWHDFVLPLQANVSTSMRS
ncbi:Synaptotagmin-like protein 3 [Labeo rohita]|uniref:Synaptotagmin-like protein 3 n=1 Tax=Labeo rohita TaxID=84645 RepID=A0ABQ8LQ30_LABRO|nr:Synaptotagmin-like protein 3 [Labeo rohita]